MRTIYIDSEHRCHVENDDTMLPIETDFFDGKCDEFIEGFCYKVDNISTTVYSWRDYSELDIIQREYEKQLLIEVQNEKEELITSYTKGVNSI